MKRGSLPKLDRNLIDNVVRRYSVLFLGADCSLGDGCPPCRPELGELVAERFNLDPPGNDARSLSAITQQYTNRNPSDRHSVIQCVSEAIGRHSKPTEAHETIAEIGFSAVVTAWQDSLMERAFERIDKRALCVTDRINYAYAGTGEDSMVIHLYGLVGNPESFVITDDDLLELDLGLKTCLGAVRSFLLLRPAFFVGWNPANKELARVYCAAMHDLGAHRRRNYIVWLDPAKDDIARWKQKNVEIIPTEPLAFLTALREAVVAMRRIGSGRRWLVSRPERIVGRLPYKFLDYFDKTDADIFFGRDIEIESVFRRALGVRLLTLFGQSGVGKTSLLRAGVAPKLEAEGYVCVFARAFGDPLSAVRGEIEKALRITPTAPSANDTTLAEFLREHLSDDRRMVVVLDQFEELFTGTASLSTRKRFWQELADCLRLSEYELHFILALREDFLPQLDEARRPLSDGSPPPCPDILRDSVRLDRFDANRARQAILEPARLANCTIDLDLIETLLGRPAPGATVSSAVSEPAADCEPACWTLTEADGAVPPSSLQIVMDRLYRAALARDGHSLPAAGDTAWNPPTIQLDLALYREQGGAGRIIADYLVQAIETQLPRKYPDVAADTARAILKAMVTARRTKAALDGAELAEEVGRMSTASDTGVDPVALDRVRDALVGLRLLRSFEQGGRALFEPAHDHIAAVVAGWLSEEEQAGKSLRELIRRQLDAWEQHRLIIPRDALRLVHERRDALGGLASNELGLVFRSALEHGPEFDPPGWAKCAAAVGVPVDDIAREGLKSNEFEARVTAVQALGSMGEDHAAAIIGTLADPYPQVRMAAISVLERLRPEGEWRSSLKYERYVPAGPFLMGDDNGNDNEKPAHRAHLKAFYIARYPVTNEEYKRYMDAINRPFDVPDGKAQHPVVEVPWYDARDYAHWAGMRLPTEAQWEKAAGWDAEDGRKREYPWGDEFKKTHCNSEEAGVGTTTPVGSYSPRGDSACGCADMAGNVWEWCCTVMTSNYKDYDKHETYEIEGRNTKVLRGGSFYGLSDFVRCACRGSHGPDLRYPDFGFRVVSSPFSPLL